MFLFMIVVILALCIFVLPVQGSVILLAYLLGSAAIVKLAARIVIRTPTRWVDALKAVLYCGLFSAIFAVAGMLLFSHANPLFAFIGFLALIFCAQAVAYSNALECSFGAGVLISLVVTVLTGIASAILNGPLSAIADAAAK